MFKIGLVISMMLFSLQLEAKTYTMCAQSYQEAKLELSSMINSSVDNVQSKNMRSQSIGDVESVSSSIEHISSVQSHLDLVDIDLYEEGSKKCAKIDSTKQVEHTKTLLSKTKTFTLKSLPNNGEKKVLVLEQWLAHITRTQQMVNTFGSDISMPQKLELTLLYKELSDVHTETLLKIDSLVFKGCGKDQETALKALDQEIFTHHKNEEKGFFETMTSWVSSGSDKELKVKLFNPYISFRKKGDKECAYIVRSELLGVSDAMLEKLEGFKVKLLPTEPKERLETVDNWLSHVEVTHSLMQVFKRKEVSQVESLKVTLVNEAKKIIPQSIKFNITGANGTKLVLNGNHIKSNTKLYFPIGTYNYSVSAKGYCPITGSIELAKLEDEEVSIDFEGEEYPSVLFVSDIDFTAMVDGISVAPNVRKIIERCSKEVQYLVKANGQSYQDSFTLNPGDSITKNFSFLNKEELSIFSDAKTKHFIVKNDEKISDSLSSYISKKLSFSVVNKPKSGSLDLDASGHFIYTPEPSFIGKVNFDYEVDNGNETSSLKVAIIEVIGVKQVPLAPLKEELKKEPKEVIEKETKEKVDQVKLESFLNEKLKANDMKTLKEAQKRFPEAFKTWMTKVRNQ